MSCGRAGAAVTGQGFQPPFLPPGAVPTLLLLSFLRLSLSREEPVLIFLLLVAVKFFCC